MNDASVTWPFVGEAICLASAALWAVSVTLFQPAIERHGAQAVNLVKCAIAALLQVVTVTLVDSASVWSQIPRAAVGWIALSGIIGLVIGDTALFTAVRSIGVHRTLLLQTLAPAFATLLAWAQLGELPSRIQGLGMAVVLAGIALVVAPRPGESRQRGDIASSRAARRGLAMATLAAACQGIGIVLAKRGMEEAPVLASSALRLVVATLGLALVLSLRDRLHRSRALATDQLLPTRVLPATLLGTYLAMFGFMVGTKLAPAAVASVLLGTSPVFSLLIDWTRGSHPGWRGLVGTLLAVGGVALLALG